MLQPPPLPPGAAVRLATPADLDALEAMVAAFHVEEEVASTPEDRRAALSAVLGAEGIGEVRILELDGVPAGYLALAYGWAIEFNGRDCFVDEIWIAPERRGAGLGSAMLAAAQADLSVRGFKAMHLEVREDREDAIRLYARIGFALRTRYRLMSWRFDGR